MLTGDIRNKVDPIWNAFWSGDVSNPLSVIKQITYLLFIKRLDDLHTREENKAANLGIAIERRVFPDGEDDRPKCATALSADAVFRLTLHAIVSGLAGRMAGGSRA